MKPRVIGIVGSCCAGKDVVTAWLTEHGWQEVNVDQLGHQALVARLEMIVARFGRDILGPDGSVSRSTLGQHVFGNPQELRALEEIVHPWMRERVREAVEDFRAGETGERGLVINAALLFHMELDIFCDAVILVRATLLQRMIRARRRDHAGYGKIVRRLWAQRGLEAQAYRSSADIITVENSRSLQSLHRRLERLPALRDR